MNECFCCLAEYQLMKSRMATVTVTGLNQDPRYSMRDDDDPGGVLEWLCVAVYVLEMFVQPCERYIQ
jgi:hypothetical protein